MRKSISQAEKLYRTYYRHFRMFGGNEPLKPRTRAARIARNAAYESYFHRNGRLSGWNNPQKYFQFRILKSGVFNRSELPF